MSRQVSFSLRQNGVSIEIVRAPYPRESMLERGLIHEIRLFKAKRLEPLWEVPAREILFALRQLERTISCHSPLLSFIFFFFFLFPPSFLPGVLLRLYHSRCVVIGNVEEQRLHFPLWKIITLVCCCFLSFLSNNDCRVFDSAISSDHGNNAFKRGKGGNCVSESFGDGSFSGG